MAEIKYSHKEIKIRIEAKNQLRRQIKEKLDFRIPEIEELLKEQKFSIN